MRNSAMPPIPRNHRYALISTSQSALVQALFSSVIIICYVIPLHALAQAPVKQLGSCVYSPFMPVLVGIQGNKIKSPCLQHLFLVLETLV
jgi:hypothetical protein